MVKDLGHVDDQHCANADDAQPVYVVAAQRGDLFSSVVHSY